MVNDVYLDMESKFFHLVPYDSEDSDDSEVESSSSQRSRQHSLQSTDNNEENKSNSSRERDRIKLKKRKYTAENATDLNNTPSGSQSEYEITNQLVYSSNIKPDPDLKIKTKFPSSIQQIKLHYGTTSEDSSSSEVNKKYDIIRKRPKLSFDINSRKGNKNTDSAQNYVNYYTTASTSTCNSSYVKSVNTPKDYKASPFYTSTLRYINTHASQSTLPTTSGGPLSESTSNFDKYVYKKSSASVSSLSQEDHFTPPTMGKKRQKSFNWRNQSLDQPSPCYNGHQLLGDSQLLRFSEQLLQYKPHVDITENGKFRGLGYCVSGQTITDLQQRIAKHEYRLANKVIMLIGTNDINRKTELNIMCDSYDSIIEMLKPRTERIVLLTVPPLPKFMHDSNVWGRLKHLNCHIKSHADNKKIFVVDLASLFISYSNSTSVEYFESKIINKTGSKPDLIHLNRDGFKMLKAILDIQYFDKMSLDK